MTTFRTIRERTWRLLEIGRGNDHLSRVVDLTIVFLILGNVTALICGSSPSIRARAPELIWFFEVFPMLIFSLEYILRFWSCVADDRYRRSFAGRMKYFFTPLALIDLLAILPFYLPFIFFGIDLRALRLFRLLEFARILKLSRYSQATALVLSVLRRVHTQIITALFMLGLLIVVSSTLMFFAETHAQPEAFPDIPHALWWGAVTVTTVGYGDVVPITVFGKLIGTFVMICGVILYGLPAAIFSHGFFEEFHERKGLFGRKKNACRHCGKDV